MSMTNPNLGAGTDARAGEPAKSSLPAAEAASELEALPIAGFQGTPEEIERQWRVAEAPADQVHQALSIRTPRWPCAGDPHAEHEDAHTAAGKARGATWAEWYGDRHIRFGIPVNEYTKRLCD